MVCFRADTGCWKVVRDSDRMQPGTAELERRHWQPSPGTAASVRFASDGAGKLQMTRSPGNDPRQLPGTGPLQAVARTAAALQHPSYLYQQ